ncbi:hypothetical protein CF326_g7501 [Tilletia indica]|nr:hypothetical protein CF326_g7501 [Tilletia indica]
MMYLNVLVSGNRQSATASFACNAITGGPVLKPDASLRQRHGRTWSKAEGIRSSTGRLVQVSNSSGLPNTNAISSTFASISSRLQASQPFKRRLSRPRNLDPKDPAIWASVPCAY